VLPGQVGPLQGHRHDAVSLQAAHRVQQGQPLACGALLGPGRGLAQGALKDLGQPGQTSGLLQLVAHPRAQPLTAQDGEELLSLGR